MSQLKTLRAANSDPAQQNKQIKKKINQENSGGAITREEMSVHKSYQSPRILCARIIRLHREMQEASGRTLNQRGRDTSETNPITIKPEPVSHMAQQLSWVPLPASSQAPLTRKSFAFVSMCVSLDN